ncbi:hypothetical protein CFP56_028187 [Quercus suber]|uniref:Uncharacterized protein n=1 Tax=Quercus suber TaxID=58331 RepID=A0AAW0JW09_QUESU
MTLVLCKTFVSQLTTLILLLQINLDPVSIF